MGAISSSVGIEKIGVYPCSLVLPMATLCQARGKDPGELRSVMMIDERALNPLWEDPVTMAVNAANSVLSEEDRQTVDLLVVATESGLDFEKPLSTWVHHYAGLNPNCRNFEIKHACYGGTAALQLGASWLASGLAADRKALIITTDQSRANLDKPWEFVLGAGASAVLLSRRPRILELELGKNGYWTADVSDVFRPTATLEMGNSETSLVSYLDALEGAFDHFLRCVPEAAEYDRYFQRHVYHMPFGGMAWRAHKALLRRCGSYSNRRDAWANFERKGLAALHYVRRMGATYSGSTFIGLLGLVESTAGLKPGELVSMFSYGSGCCAEFYCGRIGQDAKAAASEATIASRLDSRRPVSVPEYEALERQRAGWSDCGDYQVPLDGLDPWYEQAYRGRHLLTFRGAQNFYRQYEWS